MNLVMQIPPSSNYAYKIYTMSSLQKATKQISRKRKGAINTLHVNSRDSRKLHRASVRDQKLGKLAAARGRREQPLLDRAEYFQTALKERAGQVEDEAAPIEAVPIETVQSLIREFILQNAEELDELKKNRRPGRPPSAREELLRFKIDQLETEYKEQGFYMPDITNAANAALLARWDGSVWSYLVNVAWINVTAAGQARPAKFPPSGNNNTKPPSDKKKAPEKKATEN